MAHHLWSNVDMCPNWFLFVKTRNTDTVIKLLFLQLFKVPGTATSRQVTEEIAVLEITVGHASVIV